MILSGGSPSEYAAIGRMEVFSFYRFLRTRENWIKEQNSNNKS